MDLVAFSHREARSIDNAELYDDRQDRTIRGTEWRGGGKEA